MKLFKSLLVAPAALGLLAPLSATATEVNLEEISNYSDVESIEFANSFSTDDSKSSPLLAGGEGLVDSHSHDGSFSETTTASFSVDFGIGAEDTGTNDAVVAAYGFQLDLNTSFTGEDSFDVSIDAGNSGGAISELDLNGAVVDSNSETTTDVLNVDGVSYTFPVGGSTVIVGDNTDASALFTTACTYGGPSDTLSDCGNVNAGVTGAGTALGISYDFDNGFTVAAGYAGAGATTAGLATKEGADVIGFNSSYTGDNYGVSLTYGVVEDTSDDTDDTYTAINAYYTPDGLPSISVGYEVGTDDSEVDAEDGLDSWFVGLQFDDLGPGTGGVAVGTKTPTTEDGTEELMYEAYYSYPVNDGMTITPLVYLKEQSETGTDDETGMMVKTSFSF